MNYPIKSHIILSKTTLTPLVLSRNFCKFIAKYIMNVFDHSEPCKEMENYVESVLLSSNLLFSVVMISLYYLSRCKSKLTTGSEKKTFVVTLILGMKTLCDNSYSNSSWEKISGIPVDQINIEERKLLSVLNFDLMITESLYFKWLEFVQMQVQSFKSSISSPPKYQRLHCTFVH